MNNNRRVHFNRIFSDALMRSSGATPMSTSNPMSIPVSSISSIPGSIVNDGNYFYYINTTGNPVIMNDISQNGNNLLKKGNKKWRLLIDPTDSRVYFIHNRKRFYLILEESSSTLTSFSKDFTEELPLNNAEIIESTEPVAFTKKRKNEIRYEEPPDLSGLTLDRSAADLDELMGNLGGISVTKRKARRVSEAERLRNESTLFDMNQRLRMERQLEEEEEERDRMALLRRSNSPMNYGSSSSNSSSSTSKNSLKNLESFEKYLLSL